MNRPIGWLPQQNGRPARIFTPERTGMEHEEPEGLEAGGLKLWHSVTDEFELGEHELSILLEASRTVDALDALERIVRAEGVTNVSPQGVRAHPALVEARQQRVTLAKLVASLRIPLDDEQEATRAPQRRSGVRSLSAVQ